MAGASILSLSCLFSEYSLCKWYCVPGTLRCWEVVKYVPWVLVFRVGKIASQWMNRNAMVCSSSVKDTVEMEY